MLTTLISNVFYHRFGNTVPGHTLLSKGAAIDIKMDTYIYPAISVYIPQLSVDISKQISI